MAIPALFIAVITIILILQDTPPDVATEYGPFGSFAQCLTDKEVKMYGTYWCPACQIQKNLFGRGWDKISYIECSDPGSRARNARCINENITSYPTWEFSDGSRQVVDNLTFDLLSKKSGCPLPEDTLPSQ